MYRLIVGLTIVVGAVSLALSGTHITPSTSNLPAPQPTVATFDAAEHARAGWKPLGIEIDGHKDCWVLEGDTSYIACSDGFETTS